MLTVWEEESDFSISTREAVTSVHAISLLISAVYGAQAVAQNAECR